MAIQLERAGEPMVSHGKKADALEIQQVWNTRRPNLAVVLVTLAAVTTMMWMVLGMPGHEMLSYALDLVLALISS